MHIQSYLERHLFAYLKQSYGFLLVIVLIDLIPLFGILYLGWATMDAVYLYFFETLIICIITYLKMRRAGTLLAVTSWQKDLAQKADSSVGNIGERIIALGKGSFRLIRWILSVVFLFLNIPFCLLLLAVMLWIEGKGFSLAAVFGYNGGHTDLFVMNVNTFYVMITLLVIEHGYAYYAKYVKNKEYEASGVLNEALAFELRIVIQSIVMIGGVALIFFFDFSKVMMIILIVIKTLIDIFVYLRNRYWGNFIAWVQENYKNYHQTEA